MFLYFAMTVAGTIPLIGYYLLKVLWNEKIEIKNYIRILKLSILFYLCPFQLCRNYLPESWVEKLSFSDLFSFENNRTLVIPYTSVKRLSGDYYVMPKLLLIITEVVLIGLMILMAYQWGNYFYNKRKIIRNSCPLDKESYLEKLTGNHTISKYLNTKKKINIYENERITSPITIGVFNPKILMPESVFSDREKEMIMLHEVNHMKQHDILWKMMCIMVCILHWYNPFTYLLLYEFQQICEYLCDEKCIENMDDIQKKEYAMLIVRMASSKKKEKIIVCNALSEGGKRMKKRIDKIFCDRKKSGKWRVLVITVVVLFLSSMTVFAYRQPEISAVNPGDDDGFVFCEGDEKEGDVFYEKIDDFSQSNFIFIDEEGNVMPIYESNEELYVSCKHKYVKGILSKHIKSEKGCTVKKYQGKRCSKCGKKVYGKLISTTKYEVCPH